MTDTKKTMLLRDFLWDEGVHGGKSYEWFDGEALYLGNPFTATDAERKAIARVKNWEGTLYENTKDISTS